MPLFRNVSYEPEVGEIEEDIRKGVRITLDEVLTKIKSMRGGVDDHIMADLLLLQYIGDKELYEAWDKMTKWFE